MTDQAPAEAEDTPAPPPLELHGCPVVEERAATIVHCMPAQYLGLLQGLKADGFDLCSDVTAVDYIAHPGRELPEGITAERFEVVVNLVSMSEHRRVRVRCQVPVDAPSLPTAFELWPGSEAMEREVFDLMGIRFDGHPDLTRILMPDDWEGHPLRKDYAMGRIPVQFKAAKTAR